MTSINERSDTFHRSLTRSSTSRSTLAHSGHVRTGIRTSTQRRHHFSFTRCLAACCRAKIVTVEPVVFLFMFSFYLYEVMFQLYVFNAYGYEQVKNTEWYLNASGDNNGSVCLTTSILDNINITNKTHLGNKVEAKMALLRLIVGSTARLPSIVASLILGPISDRFGRKPALLVVLIGMILHCSLVLITVQQYLDVHLFILSAGLRGLTGGMAGILTASYSYIADISSKKWLTIRLGVLESMIFIAGSLSLVIGGVLIHYSNCNFTLPAILSIACVVGALPYALIALPESLDRDERKNERTVETRTLGPKALLRGFHIFFGKSYARWKLWLCLFIMFIAVANISGTTAVIILYLLHWPLQWDPLEIGVFLGSSELVHGLGLIVALPILVHSGTRDSIIVLLAVFLTCMMDVCLGLADRTWQVFAIGIVQGVDSLVTPALKSILSKTVDPKDQGALFSFVSAVQVLASVFGYVLYPTVYWHTLQVQWDHSPGISFFVMAALYIFTMPFILVLVAVDRHQRPAERQDHQQQSRRHSISSVSAADPFASKNSPGDEYESLLKANTELAVDALDGTSIASRNSELTTSWQSSFKSIQ